MNINEFPIVFYVLTAFSLVCKAFALWRAAKSEQKYWFVVLLIINSFGVLEIVYLFRFAKRKLTISEIRGYFKKQ